MSDSIVRTPWKDYMGEVPMHLEYFDGSMFEAVEPVSYTHLDVYKRQVTGYEVLAMILRAVGYDKNNEFSGADWALHVAQTAQQLGVCLLYTSRCV